MAEKREEILQELVRGEPRLLRVERRPEKRGDTSPELLLSFDSCWLLVDRVPDAPGLRVASGTELPNPSEGLVPADEEEPWWAVMGQPLVRAWALSSAEGQRAELELQFRGDADNPKLVSLALRGDRILATALLSREVRP